MSGTEAPAFLAELAARIDDRLAALFEAEIGRWAGFDPEVAALLAALRSVVLGGGKRLRPAFCYSSHVGAGGDGDEPLLLDACAALELLHASALVHDDIVDRADRRHGRETIHRQFQRRLPGGRLSGPRFGEGAAIFAGNLALVSAHALLAGAPAAARAVFAEVGIDVNIGQFLDLAGTAAGGVTPEAALRICEIKSGRYTVEGPLHLGAALLGADVLEQLREPLSAYGVPLGEAFQLRDDLLDAFGDPAVTGKPAGSDLREGKPTFLYAQARQAATGQALRLLTERYGAPDLTESDIADLQAVLVSTGARQATEELIDRLTADALAAAAELPFSSDAAGSRARAALTDLAGYVAGRDR